MGMVIAAGGLVILLVSIGLGLLGALVATGFILFSEPEVKTRQEILYEVIGFLIATFSTQMITVHIGKTLIARPIPSSGVPAGISQAWLSATLDNTITILSTPLIIGVIFLTVSIIFSLPTARSTKAQRLLRHGFRWSSLAAFACAIIPVHLYTLFK